MGDAVRSSRGRAVLLAALYVLGWLLALLALMAAELMLDPGNDVGEFFDNASLVLCILGVIAVPIGTVAIFRALRHDVVPAVIAGAVSLLVYLAGTVAEVFIYFGINAG